MTISKKIFLSIISAFFTAAVAYFGFGRQAKVEFKKEYQEKFAFSDAFENGFLKV